MASGRSANREWLRHTRSAELVVVLGEDLAAIIGLVLAFVFVAIAFATGNPIYDAIGSITIGVVLIVISVFVAVRMKALIAGRSADPDIVAAIEQAIDGDEAIAKLFNALTLQLGPTIMLAAKVKMHPDVSMTVAIGQINALEKQLKEQFPEVQWYLHRIGSRRLNHGPERPTLIAHRRRRRARPFRATRLVRLSGGKTHAGGESRSGR